MRIYLSRHWRQNGGKMAAKLAYDVIMTSSYQIFATFYKKNGISSLIISEIIRFAKVASTEHQ